MRWLEQIFAERSGIWWAIALSKGDTMVGACGLSHWNHAHRWAEIGYWLIPDYWRQGILSEALPRILHPALGTMGVHRVHANVEPENIASCSLLRKLGFSWMARFGMLNLKMVSF